MFPHCFFVRHGQTDWNAEGRLQGQAERDLAEVGRAQATGNGETLKRLIADPDRFDFVSSPMRRTRQTMELIRSAMGLDPNAYRTDERLKELHFGDWQGFTFAELERKTPGVREARGHDKWGFLPPGQQAESYEMLEKRVRGWLDTVTEPTVCVAHGGILRVVFRALGGIDRKQAGDMDIRQDKVLHWENGTLEWI